MVLLTTRSLDRRGDRAVSAVSSGRSGAGNEDRTRDLKITNLALYQLSYPGANTIIDGVQYPFNCRLLGSS
jgi:hypothetical protein